MKEITSKKTKKIQIIPDHTWDWIVAKGWKKRFTVHNMPEVKLKNIPIITKPKEIKIEEVKAKKVK